MIVSAHQPAYNPWLGYLHKILLSDVFVIMDDVQYEKNSFINRNKILQNNLPIMLTIPVLTKDYKKKSIKDLMVLENGWQKKHIKSIVQAYKKASYFDNIMQYLESIYTKKSEFLIDYTDGYLNFLVDYLDIETKIIYASTLGIKSKKLEYVTELTKKVAGDLFVFGVFGANYVDADLLKKESIKPYFQSYNHPKYFQLSKDFHPYMGILDILFNEKKEDVKNIILKNNITKKELRDEFKKKDIDSGSSSG